MSQFNSVGEKWVEKLTPLAESQTTFNMHDHLCRVTLDAISEVGLFYALRVVYSLTSSMHTASNCYPLVIMK